MANGSRDGVLDEVLSGEQVGTLFLPHGDGVPALKRWIGYTARPKGTLTGDEGEKRAIAEAGRSLLPVGVKGVAGNFGKGDLVTVIDAAGVEVARGLSNYSAADAARIAGLDRSQIVTVFGKVPYDELIHRDNLVVVR